MVNLHNINTFVCDFISNNVSDDAETVSQQWMSKEVQSQFKNLVNTASKCKKLKDPRAPKHAMSGYLYFCKEQRPFVKTALGEDAKNTDVTRELGKRWKLMLANPADAKKVAKYKKLSEADMERYKQEKKAYVPSEEFRAQQSMAGVHKKVKDPNAPKRAKSAYLYYCQLNRERVKNESEEGTLNNDITKKLGAEWNEIKDSPAKIKKYVEMAQKDKVRFEAEKAAYCNTVCNTTTTKTTKKAGKKAPAKKVKKAVPEVTVSDVDEETPAPSVPAPKKQTRSKVATPKKSPVKTGYNNFVSQFKESVVEEHPEMTPAEVSKHLSQMWKKLTVDEKEEYNSEAVDA